MFKKSGIAVFIIFITFIILELGTRAYLALIADLPPRSERVEPIGKMSKWKNLPYPIPLEDGRIRRALIDNGKVILDMPYRIDPLGRRVTPNAKLATNYLIFLGCSLTFGYGVRDDETLPAQIQSLLPAHHVYNYGFSGGTPEEFLYRLESIDKAELAESSGRIVYLFMKSHLERHFKYPDFIAHWGHKKTVIIDGKNMGTYEDVYPLKAFFHRMRIKSSFIKLVNYYFPRKTTTEELKEFAQFIDVFAKKAKTFSGKKLILVLWPGSPDFYQYTDKEFLEVIDLSQLDLQKLTMGKNVIPFDGHPTPESYRIMAKEIANKI